MTDIPFQRWLNLFFKMATPPYLTESLTLCRELGKSFRHELATGILQKFSPLLKNGETQIDELLIPFDELAESSQTAFYVATMLDRQKLSLVQDVETVNEITQKKLIELNRSLATPDIWLYYETAKLFDASGKEKAKQELQRALSLFPAYPFYLKVQGLIASLLKDADVPFKRTVRLAVLGSATTSLLIPVIKAAAFARDIRLEIYEGAFRSYTQEILDPHSELYQFAPHSVLLLLESHDFLATPCISADQTEGYVTKIRHLWNVLRKYSDCHIIQTGLNYPESDSWGTLEDTLADGRRKQIDSVNGHLSSSMPQGVSFLNVNALAVRSAHSWTSPREWHMAKQYPASAALPFFADAVVAQVAAVFGMTKKMLVLDLDNTCWGGVVGEDGLEGIKLGSASAVGESCLELQRYAKDLKERGILLSVCSKNNEKDALAPFEHHDEMILKKEDFVAFKANWNDKVSNIRRIAQEVNLGLDSFVFLDDNPAERAIVRHELPEVTVPEFGHLHFQMLQSLKRGMYFESVSLTEEDVFRHQSYQTRRELQCAAENLPNLDGFLQGLKMTCHHGPVDEVSLSRVTQLINKTNQFNLTTQRYSTQQVYEMMLSDQWWCHWFRLSDHQQNHGIVGVLIAAKQDDSWKIDTWLMSCRVIGRRLESLMFQVLVEETQKEGAKRIKGKYFPTGKNALVQSLYPTLGFRETEKENQFVYHVNQAQTELARAADGVIVAIPVERPLPEFLNKG